MPFDIDDWIALYLAGEATAEQRSAVDAWRKASEANEAYFVKLKLIFDNAATSTAATRFDTDKAWQMVRGKLVARGVGRTASFRLHYRDWLRVAATITVLLTAGIFIFSYLHIMRPDTVRFASGSSVKSDTLPDGSAVFLNRDSKLEYVFDATRSTHIARLEGEAFFSMSDDHRDEFIVQLDKVFIRDIGTEFNVRAYPGSAVIEVEVESGEVLFYHASGDGINVAAGKRGIFNKATKAFALTAPEPNTIAYKTRSFTFTNASLSAIAQTLNDVYDQQIQIGDNLKDCKLTVSFNNEDLEEIANIIAETLNLTATRNENIINLNGPGCGTSFP